MQINNVFDFNKAIQGCQYAHGGYPQYFVLADGDTLSWDAAVKNQGLIRDAIIGGWDVQWKVIGTDVNWEDTSMYCAHTGDRIESAYGED